MASSSSFFAARLARILGHAPGSADTAGTPEASATHPPDLGAGHLEEVVLPQVSKVIAESLVKPDATQLVVSPLKPHFEHILDEVERSDDQPVAEQVQQLSNFYFLSPRPSSKPQKRPSRG